jgi:hypothetical protein
MRSDLSFPECVPTADVEWDVLAHGLLDSEFRAL